jgi:hypothetical protein
MSKSFFNSYINLPFFNPSKYLISNYSIKLFFIPILFNGIYAYSTKKEKNITIVKKYKFVRNGFTEFMIIDSYGNHYNVNNSFWFLKFNSLEDWHKIDPLNESNNKNGNIKIAYYGYRIPFLGLFPNIIDTGVNNKNKNKNNNNNNIPFTKSFEVIQQF